MFEFSNWVKEKGLRSVRDLSRRSTIPVRTLNHWYSASNFKMLDLHIKEALDQVREEKRGISQEVLRSHKNGVYVSDEAQ